ncbi:tetratricopeptide repeat protein [Prochlorococcus marinus]|uniref:tetratricopeptide repeat protein n=1 Tax=Prochlorococcus marinus TaxID=1219 RepID=UPI0022B3111F|nr:tetratricopeptide repeat protein [Prochlorococcus marinus]
MVSSNKEQGKNKVNEAKTFNVPFALEEIKENLTINTNAPSKPSKPSKEKIINQALRFHSRGKIQEAAKYYQYFINQGIKDHRIFSNYGVILKNLGKLQEAELSQRKAIEIKPDYADAHFNLGNVLRDLGKLEEADLSQRKAIQLNPNFAEAYSNLGGILIYLGKLQDAELSLRKAIEIKPDYAEAYYNLGNILIDLGKLEEAELSLRKAIEVKPDYAMAHANLGTIMKDLGNLQEAEIFTLKAIEINSDLAQAHYNLGIILEDLGKSKESLRHWIKAAELKPKDEKLIIGLAHNLCYGNKYELALKYLSKNQSNSSQSVYLGCLLSLDREKEFNEKYKVLYEKKVCNADIGGIVAHANIIYGKQYESHFCNESIKYVLIDKINEELFSESNLNQLIAYNKMSKKEGKSQVLLSNGIQTSGNLFSLDYSFIKAMKKALEMKIEQYKQKFKDSGQGFINNWPESYELRSWMISMKTGGFLKSHNHEYGWITGSFYLQIPKYNDNKNDDSGNIAFSYQGPRYPNKDKNFNLTVKKLETRDICIFPSSLFHHTIPFESSEERICFVFDLVQK